jgi:hypothetical protein
MRKGHDTPKDTPARSVAEMLSTLHGHTPATCELGEVLATVTMEGDTPSEAPPRPTHIGVGLGSDPLLQGLLADREQRRATALTLGAHDMQAL